MMCMRNRVWCVSCQGHEITATAVQILHWLVQCNRSVRMAGSRVQVARKLAKIGFVTPRRHGRVFLTEVGRIAYNELPTEVVKKCLAIQRLSSWASRSSIDEEYDETA